MKRPCPLHGRRIVTIGLACVLASARIARAEPLTVTPLVSLAESVTTTCVFDDSDKWDSITRLRFGLGLSYETATSITTLNVGASALYVARDEETTVDLGEAQRLGLSTSYAYSPRLRFTLNDYFGRIGSQVRDADFANNPFPQGGNGPNVPEDEDPSGNNPSGVNLVLPRDSAFNNSLSISANYLTAPDWSAGVVYDNGLSVYSNDNDDDSDNGTPSPDDSDGDPINLFQTIALIVGHQYNPTLSLNGRAAYSYLYANDQPDSNAYSLSVGPSYTPANLWRMSALLGGTLNQTLSTGTLRATADVAADISRILENSVVSAGVRNGFTPSAGISGTSQTLTTYLAYSRRLTEYLNGNTAFTYSRFNTDSNDFDLMIFRLSLFYPIWESIGGSLTYSYRRRDAEEDETEIADFEAGVADANIISLQITWSDPLWQIDL